MLEEHSPCSLIKLFTGILKDKNILYLTLDNVYKTGCGLAEKKIESRMVPLDLEHSCEQHFISQTRLDKA